MKKVYLVQMEEIVESEDAMETIDVWEDFYDYTYDLEEAKSNAQQLLNDIKGHKISEVSEVSDPNNLIGVCIAVYDEDNDDSILDVIEVEDINPDEWNIKCGDCGAFCPEGVCSKYECRIEEDSIACERWHSNF